MSSLRGGAGPARPPLLAWAGWAAFARGLVFAGVSFYWGLGGTLGVDTLGGSLEAGGSGP